MTKNVRTARRVKLGSATAARPRKGSRPRPASPIDFEAKVEEVRGLARPDVNLDLIRDYVKIGVALDEVRLENCRVPGYRSLSDSGSRRESAHSGANYWARFRKLLLVRQEMLARSSSGSGGPCKRTSGCPAIRTEQRRCTSAL